MYNVFKVYVKEDEVLTSLPAPLQVWQVSCLSTCEIIANPYSTDFLIVHGDKSLFECIGVALNYIGLNRTSLDVAGRVPSI